MMEISVQPATSFALGIVLAWLAGVRVYLTILGIGVAAHLGVMDLPPALELAKSPLVLGICGVMTLVEFATDKIPGVDSTWDLVHTLVRVPAGAFLGTIALPASDGEAGVAGMALGAGIATLSHGLKSGTRALINTSPEPASNWTASFAEDGLALALLWLALTHPAWALVLATLATLAFVAAIALLLRLLRSLGRRIRDAVA